MKRHLKLLATGASILIVFGWLGIAAEHGAAIDPQTPQKTAASTAKPAPSADALDRLLAPIALYPDQLLAQMLLCASNPGKVAALGEWLASHEAQTGSELQDAAVASGFEASFVALVLFPDVVGSMARDLDWTTRLGEAFAADRPAVFGSIQRLRAKAQAAGTLKTNAQQEVETRKASSGEPVIVIEPANPQVVYVPQYNPTVVYTQPTTSTVVVQKESSSSGEAVAAGLIGFTAGIAIGAALDNDYYYGPYGWHGGGYMYNDAWDDYYDNREDAREDWQDHREDLSEERGDRAGKAQEQRTERQQTTQEQRTERQQTRPEASPETQAARDQKRTDAKAAASSKTAGTSQESRGYGGGKTDQMSGERSGAKSDAFSGYSSGKSERAASSRGKSSRSSSRGGGKRR